MRVLTNVAAAAALVTTVVAAHAQTQTPNPTQTPNMDQSQMDRAGAAQPAPTGRGGAVGTTGDATTGSGAVRREQQPKSTPVAPGAGGGRENQVPQMERN
jgi:hypothetical protein